MDDKDMTFPEVVSADQWAEAIDQFRLLEKRHMKLQDQLNAKRRRLPMMRIEKAYEFDGPAGKVSLLDLFAGRRQLIVYHFMYGPSAAKPCSGCSMMVDNMGHQAHLEARDTSRVLISRAPLEKLTAFKKRMGWTIPWYSSYSGDFNDDFNTTTPNGEMFAISAFIHKNDEIFRSYFTTRRGAETLGSNWSYLDITPFGRQELWEDSPEGVPQSEPYQWWRFHDEYDN